MIASAAIVGPTASGKTALSLSVAERLNAEIISCDSMQIYRKMDIGTAKATKEEQKRVPHHLIDICDPSEAFSAEVYRDLAMKEAKKIAESGKLPLFVGGTGLYLDTLLRSPAPSVPESSRAYREQAEKEGIRALWQRLCEIDPESAEKTHPNNIRRVIRALEIYDATGKTKSEWDALTKIPNPTLSVKLLVLDFHDREALYRRTDERVDEMFRLGLVEEVRALHNAGYLPPDSTAAQAIGYKELLSALAADRPPEEAKAGIKLATRHYAKRQLTWFRHEENAYRLFVDREDGKIRDLSLLTEEAIAFFTSQND